MFLDYIGQELMWLLRCNHPYMSNPIQRTIYIHCYSPKRNKEILDFVQCHTPKDVNIKIIMQPTPFICGAEQVVKEIQIETVIGGISSLKILNEEKE